MGQVIWSPSALDKEVWITGVIHGTQDWQGE